NYAPWSTRSAPPTRPHPATSPVPCAQPTSRSSPLSSTTGSCDWLSLQPRPPPPDKANSRPPPRPAGGTSDPCRPAPPHNMPPPRPRQTARSTPSTTYGSGSRTQPRRSPSDAATSATWRGNTGTGSTGTSRHYPPGTPDWPPPPNRHYAPS